ncbi:MAG: 3-deoxy-manno-octulosonate cytidylyltransferase [Saprospiraceae bacterium]
MKVVIIIPSRLQSTRLPEKPLAIIEGKSLIHRVYEQALLCRNADEVVVATDHESILNHVVNLGYKAVMTDPFHVSGTDRIAEVAANIDADVFINVQGDEPLIHPNQIDELIDVFRDKHVQIATQMSVIKDENELFDYNKVKVVTDIHHKALYFSRQAIPAHRDLPYKEWFAKTSYYKHVGIYGFRKEVLEQITLLGQGYLEQAESLEQLRWLENGFSIHCFPTDYESIGVDTPEDLQKVSTIVRMMDHGI